MNRSHVDVQCVLLNESLSTMSANKVFDKQMNLQMFIQQMLGAPTDQTIGAPELSTFDMLRFLVAVELALFVEMFVANGAGVLVLTLPIVNSVFVTFQIVRCFEDAFTHVTFKIACFTMHSQNVQIKRGSAGLAKRTRRAFKVSGLHSKVDISLVQSKVLLR